jgi:RimJ/RimL family protein N-acetyltransferase
MIRGEEVDLRPVERKDLPLIARWRNDPRVFHSFFSPFLINPSGQEKWYEALLTDPRRMIIMIDSKESRTVGMVGFDNIDRANQQCEIAFLLIDPDETDHRLVWEACSLLTQFGFQEMNMHRIYAITYDDPSWRDWFEFSCYRQEVVLRESVYMRGKFHDRIVWGGLRDDWYREMYGTERGTSRPTGSLTPKAEGV